MSLVQPFFFFIFGKMLPNSMKYSQVLGCLAGALFILHPFDVYVTLFSSSEKGGSHYPQCIIRSILECTECHFRITNPCLQKGLLIRIQ